MMIKLPRRRFLHLATGAIARQLRKVHRRRNREMGQGGPCGQDQGGLSPPAAPVHKSRWANADRLTTRWVTTCRRIKDAACRLCTSSLVETGIIIGRDGPQAIMERQSAHAMLRG